MDIIRLFCWGITVGFFFAAYNYYKLAQSPYASSQTGMIVFCLFCAVIGLYFSIRVEVAEWKHKKDVKKAERAQQMQRDKAMQKYRDGTWIFPSKQFYNDCIENGITNLDNSFSLEKAKLLAKKIMREKKFPVPDEYQHRYVNEDKLREYFQSGHNEVMHLASIEKQKQEIWNRTPHKATLDETQKELIKLACGTANLHGTEKRRFMLNSSLKKLEDEIRRQKEGQEAIRQVGYLLATSATQKKKSDWAMLGGLAQGIAGPIAGIAVAADAIHKNAEIEHWNEQNRKAVNRIALDVYSSANNLNATIDDMVNAKLLLSKEISTLSEKVVISGVKIGELWNHLKIRTDSVVKSKTNALLISTTINNTYVPKAPENVRVTVDGILTAKVYCDETLIGTATIPLPLYGVECQSSASFDSMCEYYMEGDRKYTIIYEPIALWAMEL